MDDSPTGKSRAVRVCVLDHNLTPKTRNRESKYHLRSTHALMAEAGRLFCHTQSSFLTSGEICTLHAHAHLRSILLERSRIYIYRTSTHHDTSLGIRNALVCLFLCLCPAVSVSHFFLLLLLLLFASFSVGSTVVVVTINNNHVRRWPVPQGQTKSELRQGTRIQRCRRHF
jgi:hypothetical protein